MPSVRQLCTAVATLDVILFLVASALNDHSETSVDGIVWWAALLLFLALIAISTVVLTKFVWTRRRRPKRVRGR